MNRYFIYLTLSFFCGNLLFAQETARFVHPFVKPLPAPENYHPKVYLDYTIHDSLDYVSVFLINNSEEEIPVTFYGSELDFGVGIEFLDKDHRWIDRDTLYPDKMYNHRCIVGVYNLKIPPHMFVSKKMNKQYGSYQTLARYKFYTDGQLIYSEPFEVQTDSLYIHKAFRQYLEAVDVRLNSKNTSQLEKEQAATSKADYYRRVYGLEASFQLCKELIIDFPKSNRLAYSLGRNYLLIAGKQLDQYSETYQRAICYASLELFKSIDNEGENPIRELDTWIEAVDLPFTPEIKEAFLKEFECEEKEDGLHCYVGYPVEGFITIKY